MTTATDTQITNIFREILFLPADAPVDRTAVLTDFADWDSVCQIDLIMRVEERFGIRLDEADLVDCRTLAAVIAAVEAKTDG